ncbi:MAG: hypothetical protein FWC40_00650 [Proteobacteria bacterium]|nr:hypothetical protein [Pseudomonadota bacterium]
MVKKLGIVLCAAFWAIVTTTLGCQNRPVMSQPPEDERVVEVEPDMSTEKMEIQPESEVSAPQEVKEPVAQASDTIPDLLAEKENAQPDKAVHHDVNCRDDDLSKKKDVRWRDYYFCDEERAPIQQIIAKALNVAFDEVTVRVGGFAQAFGPWVSGSYYVGEYPANKVVDTFIVDMNAQTMLLPSRESVAEIFRTLKVISDKPKPFPTKAFAYILCWGMVGKSMDLIDSKRHRHRRGICIELALQTRNHPCHPDRSCRQPRPRQETRAFLITKDYDIEELPSCRP